MHTQNMTYDSLSRIDQTATLIDSLTVYEQVVYDGIGRAFKHFTRYSEDKFVYDEGVETAFNSRGYPHKICRTTDASTFVSNCIVSGSDLYYQALAYSPRGQVTQERRAGNVSLTVDRSYDVQTGRLAVQNVNSGSLQSWQLTFDKVGNLTERFDARTNQREMLTYDKLDRLTTVMRNSTLSLSLAYDSLGNICSKAKDNLAAQTYSYGAAAGCSSNFGGGASPHQVKSAFGKSFNYDLNGDMTSRTTSGSNLTIGYDATRLSRVISSTGNVNAKSSFWYSPGGSRYKRVDEKNGSVTRTVRYYGALEKETTPGKILLRESIGGFLLINTTITNSVNAVRQYHR
jgi:YD repeat-containing protein